MRLLLSIPLVAFSFLFSKETSALSPSGDPWLLTPGPLTTSLTVKEAMLHDYGSRDPTFIKLNQEILEDLLDIVSGKETHVAVPLQGSGTFVVEAMLRTLIPRDGKVLLLVNGVYGKRMKDICSVIPRAFTMLEFPENQPVSVEAVQDILSKDSSLTHVAVVYCETTTGILNPLAPIAKVVAQAGRKLLIDAMSAFGALPLDSQEIPFDAVCASSNKCLQGVPGVGFCIARRNSLEETKGNAGSLSLDLFAQWKEMERSGQWRFTPPTHVLLAFHQALKELKQEGGVMARGRRYTENCQRLRAGMLSLGFQPLLPEELQAPIILTFLMPKDPHFNFPSFYQQLKSKGFIIYPGKLTHVDTFRIGCIGDIGPKEVEEALDTIRTILKANPE